MKIAAIDIGGTYIKSALHVNGALGPVIETPTEGETGAEALMSKAAALIASMGQVEAIGVCTRGQVDCNTGVIIFDSPKIIPNYTGTNVTMSLARAGVPVAVENDVNCMGIAEARTGAGCGTKELVCLTYGTAVGGAILHGGMLYHGAHWSAGEFGMMYVRGGFYENVASTTALVEAAKRAVPSIKNGRDVVAVLDVPIISPLFNEWTEIVAEGLASVIHAFDPMVAALGGGIMENERVFTAVKEKTRALTAPGFLCDIRRAVHGNRAGLIGAALLAQELLKPA